MHRGAGGSRVNAEPGGRKDVRQAWVTFRTSWDSCWAAARVTRLRTATRTRMVVTRDGFGVRPAVSPVCPAGDGCGSVLSIDLSVSQR